MTQLSTSTQSVEVRSLSTCPPAAERESPRRIKMDQDGSRSRTLWFKGVILDTKLTTKQEKRQSSHWKVLLLIGTRQADTVWHSWCWKSAIQATVHRTRQLNYWGAWGSQLWWTSSCQFQSLGIRTTSQKNVKKSIGNFLQSSRKPFHKKSLDCIDCAFGKRWMKWLVFRHCHR